MLFTLCTFSALFILILLLLGSVSVVLITAIFSVAYNQLFFGKLHSLGLLTTFSSGRLRSRSKGRCKQLEEHLSMN